MRVHETIMLYYAILVLLCPDYTSYHLSYDITPTC